MPTVTLAEPIKIATTPHAYEEYKAFIQEKDTSPYDITEFESAHSSRVTVDLLLIMQALHLGGCKNDVEFIFSQNYARNLHEVKSGNLHMLGQETWEEEFDETVYKSIPIVRHGEFKKRLVFRKDNTNLSIAQQTSDFSQLTAIAGLGWTVDIRTLKALKVKKILEVPKFTLQQKMILAGRVDFGLFEINFSKNLPDEFMVMPNTLIGLDGSRHFMVSKLHPEGLEVFTALEKGLAILRQRGTIRKAMIQCGFLADESTDSDRTLP